MGNRRSIFLYPFSLVYGLITSARNFLYDTGILKSHEFGIPIICIGNLTVGGTGKTPHAEYLTDLLRRNFKVAFLSRGYKRTSFGFRIAGPGSKVEDIGDEPMQIFRKFPDITVAVDRNRVNGVKQILAEKPDTGVIILDDAFQHRRITPGYSILLTDFERPMINDAMLPWGNLRENIRNMTRADIILITKSPPDISPIQRRIIVKEINKAAYQNLYFTSITYKKPVQVFDKPTDVKDYDIFSDPENSGIVLVTGIASPVAFYKYLQKFFSEVVHLLFGDHHRFDQRDTEKISSAFSGLKSARKYIITTEKDAVRLREFNIFAESLKSFFYYIPVGI